MIEDQREAQTPLSDLVHRALESLAVGPRMRLDSFPNDPSLMSSSFGADVTKEIAAEITRLRARVEALEAACSSAYDELVMLAKDPQNNPWCKELRKVLEDNEWTRELRAAKENSDA